MKLIRTTCFFLFMAVFYASYAHEKEYIFVGQNESEGLSKTAFILELVEDDFANYVKINENGEVYLKVDKVVAIPKETFSHFASHSSIQLSQRGAFQEANELVPVNDWVCTKCGHDNRKQMFECESCHKRRNEQ